MAPGTDANDVNAGNVADISADVPTDFHGSIILNGISKVSEHKVCFICSYSDYHRLPWKTKTRNRRYELKF